MRGLWPIERAVFGAAALDYPALAEALQWQAKSAKVTEFKNTGAGFFSHLTIEGDPPGLGEKSPLDVGIASVEGIEHGMGFLLFLKEGRASLLEGYVFGNGPTTDMDFGRLTFDLKPWSAAGT
jgi:hypothetical protein